MGWFYPDSKGIEYSELKEIIENLGLSSSDEQYVLGKFDGYKSKKITKFEIEKVTKEMKQGTDDVISPSEADKIKRKLLENLK